MVTDITCSIQPSRETRKESSRSVTQGPETPSYLLSLKLDRIAKTRNAAEAASSGFLRPWEIDVMTQLTG